MKKLPHIVVAAGFVLLAGCVSTPQPDNSVTIIPEQQQGATNTQGGTSTELNGQGSLPTDQNSAAVNTSTSADVQLESDLDSISNDAALLDSELGQFDTSLDSATAVSTTSPSTTTQTTQTQTQTQSGGKTQSKGKNK